MNSIAKVNAAIFHGLISPEMRSIQFVMQHECIEQARYIDNEANDSDLFTKMNKALCMFVVHLSSESVRGNTHILLSSLRIIINIGSNATSGKCNKYKQTLISIQWSYFTAERYLMNNLYICVYLHCI